MQVVWTKKWQCDKTFKLSFQQKNVGRESVKVSAVINDSSAFYRISSVCERDES